MVKKVIVGLLMVGVSFVSQGAVSPVASWSFPNTPASLTPSKTASGETATMTYTGGTPTTVGGTTVAFPTWEGTAAATIAVQGTVSASTYFVIHITGAALSDWTITYAAKTSNNGAGHTQTWGYSTDGTSWTTTGFTQPGNLGNSFSLYTVNFGTALNGATSAYFRVNGGDGGVSYTFDNFLVSAVPEPVNMALVLFGFGFAGVAVGRRFKLRLHC
jgi:hypothetical protein